MSAISIIAMIAGAALLFMLPLPKNPVARASSQGFGAMLFAMGLVGLVYTLFSAGTPQA